MLEAIGQISHNQKIIFSGIATFIALVTYIPYLVDMFRGKCKPHLYTWITIFLVTVTVAYTQVVGGAGLGAIPTILGAIINGIILFYCFRFGTRDVVLIDKICLVISVTGVISFAALSRSPIISLVIVSVAEVTAFIPTFRKTHNDPYSESLPSYYLTIFKMIFILLAMEQYNWLTVSYPLLWMVIFIIFLTLTYSWRTGTKLSKA